MRFSKSQLSAVLASVTILTGSAITSVFSQTSPVPTASTNAVSSPSTTTVPNKPVMKKNKGVKHPHLVKALRHLEEAKAELNRATGDFDGSRAKAISEVNEAIKNTRQAIANDNQERKEKK